MPLSRSELVWVEVRGVATRTRSHIGSQTPRQGIISYLSVRASWEGMRRPGYISSPRPASCQPTNAILDLELARLSMHSMVRCLFCVATASSRNGSFLLVPLE